MSGLGIQRRDTGLLSQVKQTQDLGPGQESLAGRRQHLLHCCSQSLDPPQVGSGEGQQQLPSHQEQLDPQALAQSYEVS